MPPYKLTYFNGKGRAEVARLMFAHAGVAYTDNRIEGAEWPALKSTMPWGTLPLLEDGDFKMAQSVPIYQYVAAKLGYAGSTDQERAKVNEYIGAATDLQTALVQAGSDKEKLAKFVSETCPFFLQRFESILSSNGAGSNMYFVGSKLSLADFVLAHYLSVGAEKFPGYLDSYPSLKAHQGLFFGLPGVKEYVAQRPETAF